MKLNDEETGMEKASNMISVSCEDSTGYCVLIFHWKNAQNILLQYVALGQLRQKS